MRGLNLVCVYQKAAFKLHSKGKIKLVPNYGNREFTDRKPLEVLVTDLTYVRVGRHWDYACFSIVLSNREIIGLSISTRKEPSRASIHLDPAPSLTF